MKATGKAIERLLHVAVWAQGQDDLRVRFETASVGAIDDVLEREDYAPKTNEEEVSGEFGEGGGDATTGEQVEEGSRIRRTSCLQVWIGLK